MTTFASHVSYSVDHDGQIQRRTSELPAVVKLPALSVTVGPYATPQRTARLLRMLANEIERASQSSDDSNSRTGAPTHNHKRDE